MSCYKLANFDEKSESPVLLAACKGERDAHSKQFWNVPRSRHYSRNKICGYQTTPSQRHAATNVFAFFHWRVEIVENCILRHRKSYNNYQCYHPNKGVFAISREQKQKMSIILITFVRSTARNVPCIRFRPGAGLRRRPNTGRNFRVTCFPSPCHSHRLSRKLSKKSPKVRRSFWRDRNARARINY